MLLISCVIHSKEPNIIWVDSFENHHLNKLSKDWIGRGKKAHKFYKIAKENTGADSKNSYLQVHTAKSAEFVGKFIKIDIVKYPFLNWRWRTHIFPPNGNESKKSKCDVPASINVVLEDKRVLGIPQPKTIKYSWSSTLKQGTITRSPFAYWPSRCDIIVIRSGEKLKSQWVTEKRNVLKDYMKFYKLKEVKKKVIKSIIIMSDSDNTKTISAADYDDIYFSKE